jgi:hypothetical protein
MKRGIMVSQNFLLVENADTRTPKLSAGRKCGYKNSKTFCR